VGDDDTVFHLGDARRDHVTRSTSRQGACFILSDADGRAKIHWSSARKVSPGSTKMVCLCVKAFSLRLSTRVQNGLIANWLSNTPKLMGRGMTVLGGEPLVRSITHWRTGPLKSPSAVGQFRKCAVSVDHRGLLIHHVNTLTSPKSSTAGWSYASIAFDPLRVHRRA
jgi:hypothetical protein